MVKLKTFSLNEFEAGCDEAGRGCLAGPVVAAAVILGDKDSFTELNDSKKLSKKKREELRYLIEDRAVAWAVAFVLPKEIDEINILNASFLTMHKAVNQLKIKPSHLLIDGNRFNPHPNILHKCVIKGDSKFKNIAAASILAKTYRDEYMETLAIEFPEYHWHKNKGYPTKKHKLAILEHGITEHHRKSFKLIDEQLKLDFKF